MKKKALSLLLTLAMLLSLVPAFGVMASATGPEFYAVLNSGTLSFYYDENSGTRAGTVYNGLPTAATAADSWNYDIELVANAVRAYIEEDGKNG